VGYSFQEPLGILTIKFYSKIAKYNVVEDETGNPVCTTLLVNENTLLTNTPNIPGVLFISVINKESKIQG